MDMSDDALIRRENLRALNISATDLVKSVGSSYQYWRDLMAGNKSFGEKAARRIEEGVGLPRGSLDVPGIKPLESLPEKPTLATQPLAVAEMAPVATKTIAQSAEAIMLGTMLDTIKDPLRRLEVMSACVNLIVLTGQQTAPKLLPDLADAARMSDAKSRM